LMRPVPSSSMLTCCGTTNALMNLVSPMESRQTTARQKSLLLLLAPLLTSASLCPLDWQCLDDYLKHLSTHPDATPKLTSGIWLLGQPLDGSEFVKEFLPSSSSSFQDDTNHLNIRISDLQTKGTLFHSICQPTTDLLLAADL
jgi:serine/threonine protein kinase